jgi:hypothetical protein
MVHKCVKNVCFGVDERNSYKSVMGFTHSSSLHTQLADWPKLFAHANPGPHTVAKKIPLPPPRKFVYFF